MSTMRFKMVTLREIACKLDDVYTDLINKEIAAIRKAVMDSGGTFPVRVNLPVGGRYEITEHVSACISSEHNETDNA